MVWAPSQTISPRANMTHGAVRRLHRSRAGTPSTPLADKGRVLVIHFSGNTLRARFCGKKLHFADQSSAPFLVYASAEFPFQAFELRLPRFSVRLYYQAAAFESERAGMGSQSLSHYGRPRR